jgi:NAD(P)-dependent dehydrogenase (short-subunit alcohol dehydrogenase family)
VYVVGRTGRGGPKPPDGAPGTVEDTAEEVTARGGVGIPARADCTAEEEVAAVFERVRREQGTPDVLANVVWGGHDAVTSVEDMQKAWSQPFWENAPQLWKPMMIGGPYAYLLASCHAARLMAEAGKGLIVGVTDGVIDGSPEGEFGGQLIWDLAHVCINRLMQAMAYETRRRKLAVVTLMPGFMQTERVKMHMTDEKAKKMFRYDLSESVEYVGRAVVALAADPKVIEKTGKIHFVADLAREYGFTDVGGRQIPRFNPHG